MSIAMERGEAIGGREFAGGGFECLPIYEAAAVRERVAGEEASCSSSLGRNSDSSGNGEGEEGEGEVQSRLKGPLETMDALEESLPIRRGISKFYQGKSKSFTSLADAMSSCSSAKDIGKPDNAFNRKRKNILGFSTVWDRPQNGELKSIDGSICKRRTNSSHVTLAHAISMSSSSSNGNSSEEEHNTPSLLPPRHPQGGRLAATFSVSPPEKFSFPVRSFSMTDLQKAAAWSSSFRPGDSKNSFE